MAEPLHGADGLERLAHSAEAILAENGFSVGWRAGEFFYDLTPSTFTSAEDVEQNFVWSVFSGANLSKYLIAEKSRFRGQNSRV